MDWNALPMELTKLADELARHRATEVTADALRASHGQLSASWKRDRRMATSGDGLRIPPPRGQKLTPRGAVPVEAFLTFSFEVEEASTFCAAQLADFQVRIVGLFDMAGTSVAVEDHWRSDTQVLFPNSRPPREPHPHFHFQRGGHAQEGFAAAPGFFPNQAIAIPGLAEPRTLFHGPSPRLPMLPMCPVLMIDFSVGQHDGSVWKALRDRPEYARIVHEAQARLWLPFLAGLSQARIAQKWLGGLLVH